jgi:hypothetical protein
MGRTRSTDAEKRKASKLFMRKPDGEKPLGKPRCRWMDNIKIDLVEMGWGDVDWIGLAQDMDNWGIFANAKTLETIECLHKWWPLDRCSLP